MSKKLKGYGTTISKHLEVHGWTLMEIQPEDGWGVENWIFESIWRPTGLKFILSFVADPETLEFSACVRAGENVPNYFYDSDGEISVIYLCGSWTGERLTRFIKDINDYRNQVHEGTSKKEA